MTVRVQFFAQLRDLAGMPEMQVDLDQGDTVQTMLGRLYAAKPDLQRHDSTTLVGVGVEFVGRDYVLKAGDEVAVMPPVQGG